MKIPRELLVFLACGMVAGVGASAQRDEVGDAAQRVIREYLDMPHPEKDRLGEIRTKRLRKLDELRALGTRAVAAVQSGLAEADRPLWAGPRETPKST